MGSAVSFFVVDDAIVGLTQPLTEALNQLSRGPRRACDVIEELGRREDFSLDLAGGSSRRTAGAIFHNAISPINCPAPTVPRRMGSPSSSRSISTEPLRRRKTLSAGSPSLKRTCSLAKCVQVMAVLSIGNSYAPTRAN